MRLTEQVHQYIEKVLQSGDIAIDATTGNGHDTLFLAQCIGRMGEIFTFDVQQQALRSAQSHLQKHHIQTPITWINTGHEHMLEYIPLALHGKVKAITFNLGYLPNANKNITTCSDTTLPALNASISLLKDGGVLSILAYTGHDGGREECEAVKTWANNLPNNFNINITIPQNTKFSPPEWIYIQKKHTTPLK
ncbi:MAG: class I SAM-dependent methyltransferase [Mariprofundaceae bacterium]|nr:class I SAM-dependent methyltransferase [Mariprofundaceae bacterium]